MSFISNISVFASLFSNVYLLVSSFFFTEYMMKLPEKKVQMYKNTFQHFRFFCAHSTCIYVCIILSYTIHYGSSIYVYIWNREVESKQCTWDQRHVMTCFTENFVMLRTTWWLKISYESAICTKWCSKNS